MLYVCYNSENKQQQQPILCSVYIAKYIDVKQNLQNCAFYEHAAYDIDRSL